MTLDINKKKKMKNEKLIGKSATGMKTEIRRHYYAEKSPRGFSNEIETYKFTRKKDRDNFVLENERTSTVTRKEALKNVNWKGDQMTNSYNSDMMDGDEVLREKAVNEKYLQELREEPEVQ